MSKAFEISKGDGTSYGKVLEQLKGQTYDVCFCPHQSLRSALFVSQVKAIEKVGFRKWWNKFFYTKRIVRNMEWPDALRQASLLSPWENIEKFGLYRNSLRELPGIGADLLMQIEVNRVELKLPLASRVAETNFVMLAPGSQWPTKRWGENGFAEIAKKLRDKKLEVVLVGSGKADGEINSRIEDQVPGIIDLTNQTDLNELCWLMTKAKALICNDSGLMHLASVAGLPTVAVFGPTTIELGYRPWQNQARVVEKELFCRPCGKHGHVTCPLNTHECMKSISDSQVFREFTKVCKALDQKGPY